MTYRDWETRWNIKNLQKGIDRLSEEINGMKLDNELKEKTNDNIVTGKQIGRAHV